MRVTAIDGQVYAMEPQLLPHLKSRLHSIHLRIISLIRI